MWGRMESIWWCCDGEGGQVDMQGSRIVVMEVNGVVVNGDGNGI